MIQNIKNKLIKMLGGYVEEDILKIDQKHSKETTLLESEIRKLTELVERTPEDCSRGVWCRGCVYSKLVSVHSGEFPYYAHDTVYYCTRGDFCKQFKEKEKA